jgi:hypothetical protein
MNLLSDYAPHAIATHAYARHALVDALACAGVVPGSSVALPGFICRDVLASVHALGAKTTFYDVDHSLRPIDLTDMDPSTAILAVDYFGFPQDLTAFNDYCIRTGAKLIEDNAHGLFSRDAAGALLGTRGDFGILSMRKTFHVSTGAALIAPQGTSLPSPSPCSKNADARLDRVRFTLSQWERKTGIPLMPAMRSTIRTARRIAGRPVVMLSSSSEERQLPAHHAIGCSSERTLNRQSPSRESNRRRALFDEMVSLIGQINGVSLLHNELREGVVPYGIPFRAEDEALRAVDYIARKYHVTTMSWPALPEAIEANAPAHYRNVRLVNFI